jgi:WD40 repeat protein
MADYRYPSQTTHELTGHKKTVSYLEFLSDTDIVSASTDSELRRWDYHKLTTTKQYKGHVNEKNFVGLSINGDYIVCGSENNRCFVYEKSFGRPSLEYKFTIPRSVLVSAHLVHLSWCDVVGAVGDLGAVGNLGDRSDLGAVGDLSAVCDLGDSGAVGYLGAVDVFGALGAVAA